MGGSFASASRGFGNGMPFDIMSLFGNIPGLSGILSFLSGIGTIVGVVAIIYSLLQCYFGYIIFRVMLVIQGMIAGLGIGAAIGAAISLSSGGGVVPVAIAAIVCCILGGILAHALYKLGVFLYFFIMFGFVGIGVSSIFGCRDTTTMLIIGAVVGVIFGIIGVILDKKIIIFSTAICFGASAGFSIGGMAGQLWLSIVLSILFIVTGILAQTAMTKNKSKNNANQPVPANMGYQYPPVNYAQPQQYALPCANCGNPLNPGATICPRCGKAVSLLRQQAADANLSQPAPTFAEPISEPAPYALPCANCGNPLNPGATICPRCGKAVSLLRQQAAAANLSQPAPTFAEPIPEPAPYALPCANCGNPLNPGATICPRCGKAVSLLRQQAADANLSQPAPTFAEPISEPAPYALPCANCGNPLNPGATICPRCGKAVSLLRQQAAAANLSQPAPTFAEPIPEPAPYALPCANCGNPLNPGATFCPRCGKAVSLLRQQAADANLSQPAPTIAEPISEPAPAAPTFAEPIPEPAPVAPTFAEPITEPAPTAPTFAEPTPEPALAAPTIAEPIPEPAAVAPTFAEPIPEPAPVAPTFAEPIPEPAPVAPTIAEPTPEPAPTAPTFAEPIPEPVPNYSAKSAPNYFTQPAPVAPTYPEPTFESAVFNEISSIPAKTNSAPAFCTACGAKLDIPIPRFCGVCGNRIEQ